MADIVNLFDEEDNMIAKIESISRGSSNTGSSSSRLASTSSLPSSAKPNSIISVGDGKGDQNVVSLMDITPVKDNGGVLHDEEEDDFDRLEDGVGSAAVPPSTSRGGSQATSEILPRYQRKAVNHILDYHRGLDRKRVQAAVRHYCELNPQLSDIYTIAEDVWQQLQLIDNPDEDHLLADPQDNNNPAEESQISMMSDDVQFVGSSTHNPQHDPFAVQLDDADFLYDDDDEVQVLATLSPLQEVIRIFPNAKLSFVENLLKEHDHNVEVVVQLMLEKGYDKEKKVVLDKPKEYDFNSTTWETSKEYQEDAIIELISNFPFIRNDAIQKFFHGVGKAHYSYTVKKLEEITGQRARAFPRESFKHSMNFTKGLIGTIQQHIEDFDKKETKKPEGVTSYASMLILRMSTKTLLRPSQVIDGVLEQEMHWMKSKQREDMEKEDAKMAEELNNQWAEAEGALIECQCCFSEYPFESLVQCTEGHLFCKNCLQHYVEEVVFGGGRSTIKCMSSDGCTGFFSESMIQTAVSDKVFSKYSEALTRDALKAAHIDDLVSCYHCQLQVSLPADSGIVLTCPSCNHDTCRYCNDEAHIPLKCSEVEKKSDTKARLSVEEAMTNARVRECPKCKTKFFKTEGCNKMTCSCGALLCYICRKDITKEGYKHFCQTPHCDHKACKQCKLYTNTIEDDRRAMLDAGLKTLKEVEADEANGDNNNDANKPKIEIEKLLEGGAIKANQPGLPGMPGMPGPAPMMPRVIMPQGFQVGLPAGMAAALPYNPYNPMQRANIPVVPPVPVVAHRLPPIPVRAPIIHRPRNNAQPNRKRKRG